MAQPMRLRPQCRAPTSPPLLTLILSLSLFLPLLCQPYAHASSLRRPLSFRILDDGGDGGESSDGDDDEGSVGPTASAPPSTTNCSFSFQGVTRTFTYCVPLDPSGTHRLAWQSKTSASASASAGGVSTSSPVFEVFYQGTPALPYGWAGWGISPTGKMYGSYAAVAYGSEQNTSFGGGDLYYIPGYPTVIPLTQTDSLLRILSPSLAVEVAESGTIVRSLADVSITGAEAGPVYVIWGGGPSADPTTGSLIPHEKTVGSAQVNFMGVGGSPEGGSAVAPLSGPPPSTANPPPSGSESDTATGTPPGTPSGTPPGGCSLPFQGSSQSFSRCVTLDAAKGLTLAWTPKPNTSPQQYSVLYQGAPEAAFGWAGWGVSPTGQMSNSYNLIGYGDAATSAQGGAKLYHIVGLQPQPISLNSTMLENSGLLSVVSASIQVEVVDSGKVIRTLADVTVPEGKVNVIWAGGPVADVSTGKLVQHGEAWTGHVKLDFAVGQATEAGAVTSRYNQKTVHAWLAAIGYGVLMPFGILIARHLKAWADPLWFYAHIGVQLTGYIVGAVGFGFGIWLKMQFPDWSAASEQQSQHFAIGVAIFCSSTLQILTPAAKPMKTHPARLYWNLVHWFLGYSTVILSFVNIFFGFQIMAAQRISTAPWRTVYIVVLCVWGGLLILLEPVSWHMHLKQQRQAEAQAQSQEKPEVTPHELENGKSQGMP